MALLCREGVKIVLQESVETLVTTDKQQMKTVGLWGTRGSRPRVVWIQGPASSVGHKVISFEITESNFGGKIRINATVFKKVD